MIDPPDDGCSLFDRIDIVSSLLQYCSLHKAAYCGELADIEQSIEDGCEIDYLDPYFQATPLHYAIYRKNLDAIKLLLSKGANLEVCNRDKCTPLQLAILKRDKGICKFIIGQGADLLARDHDGWTPLHYACKTAFSTEIVRLMIKKGSYIKAITKNGMNALHIAAHANGAEEVCEILIEGGCPVNQYDYKNWTPLHYAAYYGQANTCEVLLINGADVDVCTQFGSTPLHFAVEQNHYDTAELLLDYDANESAQDMDGWSALHFAADKGYAEIAKLLLSVFHAKGCLRNNLGETPLHLAARHKDSSVGSIIVMYVTMDGANKASVLNDATALHRACENGNYLMVRSLLESGAHYNPALRASQVIRPVDLARRFDHNSIVELLEQVDKMFGAASNDNAQMVKSCIESGAVANARHCINGKCPLHLAVENGNNSLVQYLLSAGAKVDLRTHEGYTSLYLSMVGKNYSLADILIRHAVSNLKPAVRSEFLTARCGPDEQTALYLASKANQLNLVRLLTESGAGQSEPLNQAQRRADIHNNRP